MAGLLKKIHESNINRRQFVGLAATVGVVTSLGLTGCDNRVTETTEESPTTAQLTGGEWIPSICIGGGCGGRCYNQSYVVDGVVMRVKTDDLHADDPDFPQQRGCVRGRLMRNSALAADRLKYPMKRKHWEPGTGGDRSLRGRDEWERITWEEALDYVANEVRRIKETHGSEAFFIPMLSNSRLLNELGGQISAYGQASQGGFPLVANSAKGDWSLGANEACDRYALRHSKLVVLWGWNPAWSHQGNPTYHFLQAKKAGARFIMVDPWFAPTAQAVVDQWIAVRPGTDAALLAGLAYHMIENDLYDQDFLNTYTIGFDADHMPEDAPADAENFKDYILGSYDGTPKTPEWASEICGVAPETIREFAQEIATTEPMAWKSTQAPARTQRGANYAQFFYTVGWMTGNVGYLGAEVTAGSSLGSSTFGGPALANAGRASTPPSENPICAGPRGGMINYSGTIGSGLYDPNSEKLWGFAYFDMWNAVKTGEYLDFANGKKPANIQCIWKIAAGSALNQYVNATVGYEAYRTVEFVVASELFMTTDAMFADIVLPATSPWERYGSHGSNSNREVLFIGRKVVEPMFESKDDSWIESELAKRLDVDPSAVSPLSDEQTYFEIVSGSTVMKEDGSDYEPLVEVTAEDIEELGVVGEPHEGRIPIKQLIETGVYQVKRHEDDPFVFVYQKAFRDDPVANPLNTQSGKLEIYCKALEEKSALMGYQTIEAIPKYVPATEGYEETFSNWGTKEKGEYPFQMVHIHHMRHCHSTYNNSRVLNELFSNGLVMNPADAESLGLKSGDSTLISSKFGKVARLVETNPRVMPGVVILGQGNWTELDNDGVDVGANVNTLAGPLPTAEAHQAFNSCLVKIEKWTGEPLTPDYLKPLRIFDFE